MNYQETIEYLYKSAPLFQRIGGAAYKPGLQTTMCLDEHFNHPHRKYRTIHVGGTNGKGSCAHTLAAILQLAGYRVGLFTSPHLIDFRERIRVNGEMIPKEVVIQFVENERSFFEPLHPSFFELTTALAFKYFADENVDVAVIEVGMGGRLDCTNIICPELAVITNISLDHTQFLGTTEEAIAAEKAGIIKSGVPVVIGEATAVTRRIFEEKASETGSPILFAEDHKEVLASERAASDVRLYHTASWGDFFGVLSGSYQTKNTNTILVSLNVLAQKFRFTREHVQRGFQDVNRLTGLRGRWEVVCDSPKTVCDAGHNVGGWNYLARELEKNEYQQIHVVFGMVGDKDIKSVLSLLPKTCLYYFTQASVERAMPADKLKEMAGEFHLKGDAYHSVDAAYKAAVSNAGNNDFIYVGGSCFIVADFLANIES